MAPPTFCTQKCACAWTHAFESACTHVWEDKNYFGSVPEKLLGDGSEVGGYFILHSPSPSIIWHLHCCTWKGKRAHAYLGVCCHTSVCNCGHHSFDLQLLQIPENKPPTQGVIIVPCVVHIGQQLCVWERDFCVWWGGYNDVVNRYDGQIIKDECCPGWNTNNNTGLRLCVK